MPQDSFVSMRFYKIVKYRSRHGGVLAGLFSKEKKFINTYSVPGSDFLYIKLTIAL